MKLIDILVGWKFSKKKMDRKFKLVAGKLRYQFLRFHLIMFMN